MSTTIAKRGRPKLSEEQLAINKQATLERRRIARQQIREREKTKRNTEKNVIQENIKTKRVMRYRENESADSPHNLAYYKYKRDQMRERGEI